MLQISTRHQIMDSSLALGRLEIKSSVRQESDHCGPANEKNLQDGPQAQLNGCVPLSHQVAGHKYGVDKVGILQHPDGTVLKQLQPPPRGLREMQFYSKVFSEDCSNPCLLDLQCFLPTYYGTWSSPETPNDMYLKLEDVTRRFVKPCIMDVKIGQRSYDPFASQEKREQQIKKYPLMEEIGFLVLGMRIYQVTSDSYETYDQHYGRSLVKDTLKDGLAKFFHNGSTLRKDAISASIQRVREILRWFEGQSQFHFYASSLLFVYEGSPSGKTNAPKTGRVNGGVTVNNNNIRGVSPAENSQGLPNTSRLQKGDFAHNTCECPQDNGVRKCGPQISLQLPNGNSLGIRSEMEESPGGPGLLTCSGVEVRMIDFAHVFPSKMPDEGYIFGLRSLLSGLQQILDQ
ncbi:inositol polyphosphate multikinase-like [Megalops cyprinoides]|uniref:inositol polyphosphate multikinase-like n=1 Tax=Megalops cyprinoides TaxID=118141 RepID=UPI0018654117|nr:inositol polyphosphate multikinase-like [Megalops cyprinoides]